MSIQETQAHIKSAVWQAIAQSNLDLSALDQKTLEALVELIIQATLIDVDSSLTESRVKAATKAADAAEEDDEKILWEGQPFLSPFTHYTLTDERLKVRSGFLGKDVEIVELVRIQDLDYDQSIRERLLNLGDVIVHSHDATRPKIILDNVKDPEQVYETLRRAVKEARKRHNFAYREEM